MKDEFIYPDFSNSLVNIPQSILAHFGLAHKRPTLSHLMAQLEGREKVVLFLADGLGYGLWKKQIWKESQLYQKLWPYTTKITSVFPSSTPPALTTLSTGLTPLEHGLLDWNVYFREVDAILETLPYRFAVPSDVDAQSQLVEKPEMLFSGQTIYEQLSAQGVDTYYFVASPYHASVYTQATARGATVCSYDSMEDLLQKLKAVTETAKGPLYCYVHWAEIDAREHAYGSSTREVEEAVQSLLGSLDRFFSTLEPRAIKETSFILTADHGQISVNPQQAVYLNQYADLETYLQRSGLGKCILPTGGARALFLSINEGQVDDAISLLRDELKDRAIVTRLDGGCLLRLYGSGVPHPEFSNRAGNVLVLPKSNNTVWYKYAPDKPLTEYGDHGGLSEAEMFVPLIAFKLSEFIAQD